MPCSHENNQRPSGAFPQEAIIHPPSDDAAVKTQSPTHVPVRESFEKSSGKLPIRGTSPGGGDELWIYLGTWTQPQGVWACELSRLFTSFIPLDSRFDTMLETYPGLV